MDAVQRLTYNTSSSINPIKLRSAYRMLLDLKLTRSQAIMELLHEVGPLNVTEIETLLFRSGDTYIQQATTSQVIGRLRKHRVILRHPAPPSGNFKHHYYMLNRPRLLQIQRALDRFFHPQG